MDFNKEVLYTWHTARISQLIVQRKNRLPYSMYNMVSFMENNMHVYLAIERVWKDSHQMLAVVTHRIWDVFVSSFYTF